MGNQQGLDRSSIVQQTTSNTAANASTKYEDEFEGGWNQARAGVVAPKHDQSVFTGGHGETASIEGVSNGQRGFGNRLWAASTEAAAEHSAEWGAIAVPVTPVIKACDEGIAEQQASATKNGAVKGDPDWLAKTKAYSVAWAADNEQTMMRYNSSRRRSASDSTPGYRSRIRVMPRWPRWSRPQG